MPKIVQLQRFHEQHGHLTEFSGFNMPLWFSGIIPEALAVRNAAGMFDVSHMGRAMIRGRAAQGFLDRITTNDVASLGIGRAHYALMCNLDGGIKDDVTVYRVGEQEYLIVYNAGNREKDYDWILGNSRGLDVIVEDVSDDVAMFAVQGPKAREIVQGLSSKPLADIQRFGCSWTELADARTLVSRTGYTGEDGFEIFVWDSPISDPAKPQAVWDRLLDIGKLHGLEPCGLGARDLLRLEAGMCLYGSDIDETTNPIEARLGFVVKLHKDFIGKERIQEIKEKGAARLRVGLLTLKRVIPRPGFKIHHRGGIIGTVTSGTLSPVLNTGIAMGYVETQFSKEGSELEIQIRERLEKARVVRPPFYDITRYGYLRKI